MGWDEELRRPIQSDHHWAQPKSHLANGPNCYATKLRTIKTGTSQEMTNDSQLGRKCVFSTPKGFWTHGYYVSWVYSAVHRVTKAQTYVGSLVKLELQSKL